MILRPKATVALLALTPASTAAPLPVKPPFSIESSPAWHTIKDDLSFLNIPSSNGNDVSGNLAHQGSYYQAPVHPTHPFRYGDDYQPNPATHIFHAVQASQEPSALGWGQLGQNDWSHPANVGQGLSSTNVHLPLVDYPSPYFSSATGEFQPNHASYPFPATQASQEPSAFGLDYHPFGQNDMLDQGNVGQGTLYTNVPSPPSAHPSLYGSDATDGFQETHHAAYPFPATQASQEPSALGWGQHVENDMLHQGNAGQGAWYNSLYDPLVAHPSAYGSDATGGRQATHDALDDLHTMQPTYNYPAADDWSSPALFQHGKQAGSKSIAVENTASHPFAHQPEAGSSRTDGGSSDNLQQGSSRHQPPVFAEPHEPVTQTHREPSPRQGEPQSEKHAITKTTALHELREELLTAFKEMMRVSYHHSQGAETFIQQVHWLDIAPTDIELEAGMRTVSSKRYRLATGHLTEEWNVLRDSSKHATKISGHLVAVQRVNKVAGEWRDFHVFTLDPKQNTKVYVGRLRVSKLLSLSVNSLSSPERKALGYERPVGELSTPTMTARQIARSQQGPKPKKLRGVKIGTIYGTRERAR